MKMIVLSEPILCENVFKSQQPGWKKNESIKWYCKFWARASDKASPEMLRNTIFHSNTMLPQNVYLHWQLHCTLICLLGAAGQHGCLFALNIYAESGGDKGQLQIHHLDLIYS